MHRRKFNVFPADDKFVVFFDEFFPICIRVIFELPQAGGKNVYQLYLMDSVHGKASAEEKRYSICGKTFLYSASLSRQFRRKTP